VQKYSNTNILNSTILKVGHHGSNSSLTKEFLDAVNPKIALIGVGENNKYGHPGEEVLERLEKAHIKIFRTDEDGEISINIKDNFVK
jgi:competence protein ComEC